MLDRALQALAGALQFLFHVLQDGALLHVACGCRFQVRAQRVFHFVEEHQHEIGAGFRIVERSRDHVDKARRFADLLDLDARLHALVAVHGLEQRAAQLGTQRRISRGHQVAGRLATGQAQVAPNVLGQVHDAAFAIHDHGRWRVVLQYPLMHVGEGKAAMLVGMRGLRGQGRPRRDQWQHRTALPHRARLRASTVDAVVLVHDFVMGSRAVGGFRRAEEQVTARPQCKVEHVQQPLLDLTIEVDQKVPATDQIDARKRRIAQNVVHREQHAVADRLVDAVTALFLAEELTQPGRRHVGHDRLRIHASAAEGNRALVDVAGEHLKRRRRGEGVGLVGQQHRDRIRFLAGGAARHPYAHRFVAPAAVHDLGHHLALQRVERFAVAEEVGDADQHVVQQRPRFLRTLLQEIPIGRQVLLHVDLHAPLDPAQHGGALVVAEVVAGAHRQDFKDFAKRVFGRFALVRGRPEDRRIGVGRLGQLDRARVVPPLDQLVGNLRDRQHEIDLGACDRAARHVVVFGIVGRLHERHPALLLDARDADRAVRTGAGQHDAHGLVLMGVGERAEEQIDRHMMPARTDCFGHPQVAVAHREVLVGRDHVDVIGLQRGRLSDLYDRHPGRTLQDLVGDALVLGRQVQDHHEGQPGLLRHVLEERFQRNQSAGRRAQPDDRKRQVAAITGVRIARDSGFVIGPGFVGHGSPRASSMEDIHHPGLRVKRK